MNITAWQEYIEETKKLEEYQEVGDNTLAMDVAKESVKKLYFKTVGNQTVFLLNLDGVSRIFISD